MTSSNSLGSVWEDVFKNYSELMGGHSAEYKGEYLPYDIIGHEDVVPRDFFNIKGFDLPKGWQDMHVVVDGYPCWGVTKDEFNNAAAVKETLEKQKGKKKNECYPAFNKPPKLLDDFYYFRAIVMYRDKKLPLLYIGFDIDAARLDSGFWIKALDLKSKQLNPKSAQPTVTPPHQR